MSLILDALRKADAERERGSVPSLHSQPVAATSAGASRKPATRPNWLWIAIGVGIGLGGAAAWMMLGSGGSSTSATPAPAPAQAAAPSAAPAAPVAPAPPVATAPVAARADSQPAAEPAPWRQPDERRDTRADGKSVAPPQVLTAPTVEAPAMSRDQLPPNIRSELPQFAVGGSIYSTNPAARSLIVNGQLYREKDRLTQDLSLDEIKLKSAIFSFRGYRFEVMF